jgi:hypothetical protein
MSGRLNTSILMTCQYFDDMPGRRMRPNLVDRAATARRAAEFLARAEQDALDSQ